MSRSSHSFLVGLVGTGIGPSLTPALHEREADQLGIRYLYRRLDLDELRLAPGSIGDILSAARLTGYDGLNVTHPCKQLVLAHLDELSPDAEALGAVNTVVLRGGRAVGHNTDGPASPRAFDRGLRDAALDRVVLLGAGGAGAAVAHALLTLGTARLTVARRRPAPCTRPRRRSLTERSGRAGRRARTCLDVAGHAPPPTDSPTPRPPAWLPTPGCRSPPSCCAATCGWPNRLPPAGDRARAGGPGGRLPGARRRRHGGVPGGRRLPAVHRPSSRTPTGCSPTSPAWSPRRSATSVSAEGPAPTPGRSRRSASPARWRTSSVAAAAAGFDGIEVFEPDLIASPWAPAELARPVRRPRPRDRPVPALPRPRLHRRRPLRPQPPPPRVQVRGDGRPRHRHPAGLLLGLPDAVDDVDRLAGPAAQLADLAAVRGMRIAYEALAWGRHVCTWDRSWDAVRRADPPPSAPAWTASTCSPAARTRRASPPSPAEKLFFLQLADAPHMDMDVLQWSRHYRLFPGQGAFDVAAVLAACGRRL